MGGNLAFNASFVSIGAAGSIASVVAGRTIDAFHKWIGTHFVVIRAACAFQANGTNLAAASNIAHDGRAAARTRCGRTRRTSRAAVVCIAAISGAAASFTTIGELQILQTTDDLTAEKTGNDNSSPNQYRHGSGRFYRKKLDDSLGFFRTIHGAVMVSEVLLRRNIWDRAARFGLWVRAIRTCTSITTAE